LLLEARDAIAAIEIGERIGWKLLGIDAFRVSGKSIQPLQDYSIDFGFTPTKNSSDYRVAVDIIESSPAVGIYFELIFDNDL